MPTNQRELGAQENVLNQVTAALRGLVDDIQGLIAESHGVVGLHLNGAMAPWGELESGGQFERLTHLPAAIEALQCSEVGRKCSEQCAEHAGQTAPRDVLMAAMREVQEQSAVFAKQHVVSEPFIRHCINLGEIADRYASQVQPEHVPLTAAGSEDQAVYASIAANYHQPEPVNQQMMQVFRAKLKSRRAMARDIPTDQRGWWFDVSPGQTLNLRQAVQADLDRCRLDPPRSQDPADYMCEIMRNGSLVSKAAIEYMHPEQNMFAIIAAAEKEQGHEL